MIAGERVCDRCHARMGLFDGRPTVTLSGGGYFTSETELDLCDRCLEELRRWLEPDPAKQMDGEMEKMEMDTMEKMDGEMEKMDGEFKEIPAVPLRTVGDAERALEEMLERAEELTRTLEETRDEMKALSVGYGLLREHMLALERTGRPVGVMDDRYRIQYPHDEMETKTEEGQRWRTRCWRR